MAKWYVRFLAGIAFLLLGAFSAYALSAAPSYAVFIVRDSQNPQGVQLGIFEEVTARRAMISVPHALWVEKGPISGLAYVLEAIPIQGVQFYAPRLRRFRLPDFTEVGQPYALPIVGAAAASAPVESAIMDMEIAADESVIYVGYRDAAGSAPLVADILTAVGIDAQGFQGLSQLLLGSAQAAAPAYPVMIAPSETAGLVAVSHTSQTAGVPVPQVSIVSAPAGGQLTLLAQAGAPASAQGAVRDVVADGVNAYVLFSPQGLFGQHMVRRIGFTAPFATADVALPPVTVLALPVFDMEISPGRLAISGPSLFLYSLPSFGAGSIPQCAVAGGSLSDQHFSIEVVGADLLFLRGQGSTSGGAIVRAQAGSCAAVSTLLANGLVTQQAGSVQAAGSFRSATARTPRGRYYLYSSRSGAGNATLYLNALPLGAPWNSFAQTVLMPLSASPTAALMDIDAAWGSRRDANP